MSIVNSVNIYKPYESISNIVIVDLRDFLSLGPTQLEILWIIYKLILMNNINFFKPNYIAKEYAISKNMCIDDVREAIRKAIVRLSEKIPCIDRDSSRCRLWYVRRVKHGLYIANIDVVISVVDYVKFVQLYLKNISSGLDSVSGLFGGGFSRVHSRCGSDPRCLYFGVVGVLSEVLDGLWSVGFRAVDFVGIPIGFFVKLFRYVGFVVDRVLRGGSTDFGFHGVRLVVDSGVVSDVDVRNLEYGLDLNRYIDLLDYLLVSTSDRIRIVLKVSSGSYVDIFIRLATAYYILDRIREALEGILEALGYDVNELRRIASEKLRKIYEFYRNSIKVMKLASRDLDGFHIYEYASRTTLPIENKYIVIERYGVGPPPKIESIKMYHITPMERERRPLIKILTRYL